MGIYIVLTYSFASKPIYGTGARAMGFILQFYYFWHDFWGVWLLVALAKLIAFLLASNIQNIKSAKHTVLSPLLSYLTEAGQVKTTSFQKAV